MHLLIVAIPLFAAAIGALVYFWILAPRKRPGTGATRHAAYETPQSHPWSTGGNNRRDLR